MSGKSISVESGLNNSVMVSLLHHLLERAAGADPGKEALVDGDRRVSYRDFAAAAATYAAVLRAHGLDRGDRVATYLDKSCEEAFAIFGTSMAGGVFVPINSLLRPRQVAHILDDCGVRFLITTAERNAALGDELARLQSPPRILPVPEAFAAGAAALTPLAGDGGGLAAILYTSGSTGFPKGAMLSHHNLLAGSRIVCRYLDIRPVERVLSVLPFSFDYGLNQLITAVEQGATTVLLRFRFGSEIVAAMRDERITGLAGVPGLWAVLSDAAPAFRKERLETLRYMTNSGGAMPVQRLARIRAAQPQADFILMYGFTEAFRSTYLPASELDHRPTSMGRAIPETEVFALNDEGNACRAGEEGILVHDGPTVFLGYWNKPEETRAVLRPHPLRGGSERKVCYSGDRVTMDEDGYFYFVGRDDAMIKSAGYRVSPTEVESVLLESGQLAEAAVIGVPHPTQGQAIKALVAVREGVRLDTDDLLAFCAERLPRYMVPVAVEGVDALPKNPNGKVDYPALRRRETGS